MPGLSSAADIDPAIIRTFLEQSKALLQQGQANEAADRLGRAFLLDPQNKDVRERLLEVSNHPSLRAEQKLQLNLFNGLLGFLNNLEEKRSYFEQKRKDLLQQLVREGTDEGYLTLEMRLIEDAAQKELSLKEAQWQKWFLEKKDPLGMINASLQRSRQELLAQTQTLQEQFTRLKEINKERSAQQAQTARIDEKDAYPPLKQTQFVSAQEPALDQTIQAKMAALSKQVVDLSLKLEEARNVALKSSEQIGFLKEQIDGFKSRHDLSERIIDEKNQEMVLMNQQIADLQAQLKLREHFVQEKDDDLTHMQQKSSDETQGLVKENQELKQLVRAQRTEIRQLDAMLEVYQERSAFFAQPTASVTTDQIEEYKGIIEIYQWFLKEARDGALAANKEFDHLEKDLEQIKEQLTLKSQLLLDTEYKLMTIKRDLTDVQAQFAVVKNLPEAQEHAQLEAHMDSLEEKLQSIHKFLLQQLSDFEKLNSHKMAGELKDIDRVLKLNMERIEKE